MNWKLAAKSAIALIALGNLAMAGEVTAGQQATSGIALKNGIGLMCGQLNCGSVATPLTADQAYLLGGVSLSVDSAAARSAEIQAALAAALANQGAGLTDPNTDAAAPSFILADGKATLVQGGVNSTSSSSGNPRVIQYGDNSSADPVPFTSYSTTLGPMLTSAAIVLAPSPAGTSNTKGTSLANSLLPTLASAPSGGSGSSGASNPSADVTPAEAAVGAVGVFVSSDPLPDTGNGSGTPSNTPEPATDLLIGTGLVCAGVAARNKGRRKK